MKDTTRWLNICLLVYLRPINFTFGQAALSVHFRGILGADPGFRVGGGATYDYAKIFQKKLHEIEKILSRGPPPQNRHRQAALQLACLDRHD